MILCRACGAYYDGNAQCCQELDHVYIPDDLYERKITALRALSPLNRDVKEIIFNIIYDIEI
tara:strand:- start:220 stop:405 length:186 start_codon:yes stop_codon:yes gene_type:complete